MSSRDTPDRLTLPLSKAIQAMKEFIAGHYASKYLVIYARCEVLEVLRFYPMTAVIDNSVYYWQLDYYKQLALVYLEPQVSLATRNGLNEGFQRDYDSLFSRQYNELSPKEVEELLLIENQQFVGVDYRPAESLPEDYYAG